MIDSHEIIHAAQIIRVRETRTDLVHYGCDCNKQSIVVTFTAGFAPEYPMSRDIQIVGEVSQIEALYIALGKALNDARSLPPDEWSESCAARENVDRQGRPLPVCSDDDDANGCAS